MMRGISHVKEDKKTVPGIQNGMYKSFEERKSLATKGA